MGGNSRTSCIFNPRRGDAKGYWSVAIAPFMWVIFFRFEKLTPIMGVKITPNALTQLTWVILNYPIKLNFTKTWEMIIRGNTTYPLPEPLPSIIRKSSLEILGVTLQKNPGNWDLHFQEIMSKACSRMYIVRVCKYYGFQKKIWTYSSTALSFQL